jgi:hypothetical protein
VALAGRRVDAADAETERFPLRNRERVAHALASALVSAGASTVVSSAACGADLLALEAAGVLGMRRRVVLPFAAERFRAESVTDRPGDWGPLFDAVIADAIARGDLVIVDAGKGDEAYARTNAAILAEADALAAAGHEGRVALIVWDGTPRGGYDLTEHFRAAAASQGWDVREVSTR